MTYEMQLSRVTCFGKVSDRFLSCQHQKSTDLTKSGMGEIFSVMEILSPWYNSSQIGQMILNNFSSEYYNGGSTSDLVNFENALKKVNESLAQITQNGETEWIGNLNGILATLVDNNLILSSSGKVEAYLFRDGKINHLTEGLADKIEVHPLKTFSNIVSGELKTQDKLLFANKNLFEIIPLESLRQILALNEPHDAGLQITKLLRKAKAKTANLIIVGLFSQEDLANKPLKDNPESVYYLDKSTESFIPRLKSLWQSTFGALGQRISRSQSLSKMKKGLGSAATNVSGKISAQMEKRRQSKKPEVPADADVFQKEFIMKDNRDDQLLKDEEIQYSPDYYIHHYKEQKNLQKENKFIQFIKTIGHFLAVIFNNFLNLYRDRSKRKYFYIICAAIFILIIALVIALRNNGSSGLGNLDSQKVLDQAISAQKDGKNLLSSGASDKAKDKFLESIELAKKISQNALVAKDAQNVISTSYQELDKLTATTRFSSLNPIVTISETGKAVFIMSGQAYLVTESDIYKASLVGGKAQKIASIPKSSGNFLSGAPLNNVLYLYTSNQNMLAFDPSTGKIEKTPIASDGRWETANAITGYSDNLYLLDGIVGQIYRHPSSTDVFNKGEEYLSGSDKLKESLSIAIDGSIYVLKNNGQVLKYERSKQIDFSLKNIPTPTDKITEPRKIFTDSDTPSLYVLDNSQKRILEFDKDGVFIKQYALPDNLTKISDFYVSTKSKKIWILDSSNLYEISI